MKFTAQLFFLVTFATAVASAAPYDVTLSEKFQVGGTELKPGDYKVEMQGTKAIFTMGKKTVQVPATLAKSERTWETTVFVSQRSKLKEIDPAGTQDRIILGAASGSPGN